MFWVVQLKSVLFSTFSVFGYYCPKLWGTVLKPNNAFFHFFAFPFRKQDFFSPDKWAEFFIYGTSTSALASESSFVQHLVPSSSFPHIYPSFVCWAGCPHPSHGLLSQTVYLRRGHYSAVWRQPSDNGLVCSNTCFHLVLSLLAGPSIVF